jgi:Cu+-exporting ATPase
LSDHGVDIVPARDAIDRAASMAQTVSLISVNGVVAAACMLTDPPRPSAADAVKRLARLGVTSRMLTGDSEVTARAVAREIGIELVDAGVNPDGKVAAVRRAMSDGRRVAMVGDGVNDAAALAAADVGMAFATGADVAGAAAGINLIGSTPHLVADAVELARRSVRIIRQNLFWAFAYNVAMLPLAAVGRIPPGWAAGAMMLSSITVVLNALRLRLPPREND